MKIVHVTECFAGGIFEFLVQLVQGLKEQQHVIVYSNRSNTPVDFFKYFPVETEFILWKSAQREINPLKDISALLELKTILINIPDKTSIHLHSSKAGFIGRLVSYILNEETKVVYTAHGAAFLRMDVGWIERNIYAGLERIGSWFGGTIVACSMSEKKAFEKQGIFPVQLINNGVKLRKHDSEIRRNSCESKNDYKKITVASVGRLSVQKNPCQFNQIAQAFIDEPNVEFIWIGDGKLHFELTAKNIKTVGWVSQKEVIELLGEVDIYISTSLWEGMPLSVLEAMSDGKPLIISDCVGNRDLVKENGYLFKNTEEAILMIRKLIQNDELRKKFANQSLENIRTYFSMSSMLKAYLSLYKK